LSAHYVIATMTSVSPEHGQGYVGLTAVKPSVVGRKVNGLHQIDQKLDSEFGQVCCKGAF